MFFQLNETPQRSRVKAKPLPAQTKKPYLEQKFEFLRCQFIELSCQIPDNQLLDKLIILRNQAKNLAQKMKNYSAEEFLREITKTLARIESEL